MKTLSNNFKLDKGNEIWQRSLIERQKRLELTNRPKIYLKCMIRFRNFLATCKLFLQKSIERTQNEHEF